MVELRCSVEDLREDYGLLLTRSTARERERERERERLLNKACCQLTYDIIQANAQHESTIGQTSGVVYKLVVGVGRGGRAKDCCQFGYLAYIEKDVPYFRFRPYDGGVSAPICECHCWMNSIVRCASSSSCCVIETQCVPSVMCRVIQSAAAAAVAAIRDILLYR
jgi:hypothetical protein